MRAHIDRFFLIFAMLCIPFSAYAEELGKSFKEDFDELDTEKWYISDGWRNGEYQNCLWNSDQVNVRGGKLILGFDRSGGGPLRYKCGELRTYQSYGYGLFEARIKTGQGSGLNAAFFTYIGPSNNKPHDEIDVEILTKDTNSVSFNTYVSGEPHHGKEVPLQNPTHTSFNIYSMLWTPREIRWYVNGEFVHKTIGTRYLPTHPQKIFASLWGSDTNIEWMGEFRPVTRRITMEIDWIAYTSLSDSCQFDASVMCDLRQ
ncbi:family 16 glycosylhydrolase [Parasulfitobacter algicola]|uniref:Family 16 glycosylhydrolase n=1 Tax=Parasulfitobacter algicola TaxID=2614809 RepID=A0ABX2IQS5_9RHOB|nr:family 16 glycosylhydrolase [Sulfitobacter algicola]NSX54900.1 family 16 glycosylhydrolase [Sulfitobacter algicola]